MTIETSHIYTTVKRLNEHHNDLIPLSTTLIGTYMHLIGSIRNPKDLPETNMFHICSTLHPKTLKGSNANRLYVYRIVASNVQTTLKGCNAYRNVLPNKHTTPTGLHFLNVQHFCKYSIHLRLSKTLKGCNAYRNVLPNKHTTPTGLHFLNVQHFCKYSIHLRLSKTLKGSNAYRNELPNKHTTLTGSHPSTTSIFYKHSIPSGLLNIQNIK